MIAAPVPLGGEHRLDLFSCGTPSLDDWLRKRARANAESGASRTYVACADDRIAGYYALAAGAVTVASAHGRCRRNMPEPIPVIALGRLAVDRDYAGKGLGRALVRDASLRVLQAGGIAGVRGVLVEAISDDAKASYLAPGMSPLAARRHDADDDHRGYQGVS